MLVSRHSRIELSADPAEGGHRPAVDRLFRSAAQHFGPRVIGIILSGSRDDGAAGLATIVEHGGVPIVRDPDTALYRSMPSAALERLLVNHVLHPAKVGKLVAELVAGELPDSELPAGQTAIAERGAIIADRSRGRPTGLSCPSCREAIFEPDGAPPPRYRCRFGHAWSAESLQSAQNQALTGALWTALRALEEWSALSRQLAAQGGTRGSPGRNTRHAARIDRTERAAEQIRHLLGEIS